MNLEKILPFAVGLLLFALTNAEYNFLISEAGRKPGGLSKYHVVKENEGVRGRQANIGNIGGSGSGETESNPEAENADVDNTASEEQEKGNRLPDPENIAVADSEDRVSKINPDDTDSDGEEKIITQENINVGDSGPDVNVGAKNPGNSDSSKKNPEKGSEKAKPIPPGPSIVSHAYQEGIGIHGGREDLRTTIDNAISKIGKPPLRFFHWLTTVGFQPGKLAQSIYLNSNQAIQNFVNKLDIPKNEDNGPNE